MTINIDQMLNKLGQELINSPYLSIMITNKKYQMVWHNQRFADEFNNGQKIEDKTCFQSIGQDKVHENCPLQKSLNSDTRIKGFLDFGDNNFFFLTIPIDEEHAAKVHVFLPKQANDEIEEK